MKSQASKDKVVVKLSVQHRCAFGEVIKVRARSLPVALKTAVDACACCGCVHEQVVGNAEEFGSWDTNESEDLTWSEGDVWQRDVLLGPGLYEFKVRMPHAPTLP